MYIRKLRFTKLLFVVMLIVSLLGTNLAFGIEQDSNTVTTDEARQAAEVYIEKLVAVEKEWLYDALGEITVFKDLSDEKTAYVISVIKEGESIGYITVSATKDKMPILEASLSTFSQEKVNKVRKLALENLNNGEILGTETLRYLGALSYYVEFPVLNQGEEIGLVYYDLKEGIFVNKDKDILLQKEHKPSNPAKALEQWKKIMKEERVQNSSDFQVMSAMYGYKDLSVPIYKQSYYTADPNSGCGPTTGAMILEYWRTNGYSSIKTHANYYSSLSNFLNHVGIDMDTGIYGTMAPEWANGMKVHTNTHASYSFTTSEQDSVIYGDYTSSIDSNKPVGILWDRFTSAPYEWHWTAGRGYSWDDYGREIKVNDPWDGVANWVSFDEYYIDMDFVFVNP